ncbi:WD40 domain-containing protein/DENN domain-containing protein/dDENN domain-containing protein/uDENN domain-containing protein/SBF2 domain-containing protein [Cephalotus follicularis]|uniref:WD40 domain-containing protein/DENN domain-containing protein/dDENN domain-containing protein/uDENN domain-containing protein/SBF2 domain-containing protein n=1 Tax=Cephalotus follicularis TaxID=3775 RepID=A0A1Q3CD83_CEPFO|nr:WD40 domain-containing protein/DENN domain-containing protein/dDENN domain-containing protein/uDENN domain-containing protein/SBF2 domain-containing protein [Cephalotus follicularis]
MAPIFEYFVVCGLGPEIRTLDGDKGYHGTGFMYMPSLLDLYPPSNHSLYPPPPPQLPTCVLPAGVEFFPSGFDSNDASTFPRSYPIVLTEGDGSKIYVSCIAFRDPVSEDIAEGYRIPPNSFADKCICLVSRSPSFRVLRSALEELFSLCFSPDGSSKPLWDVVAYLVSNVPLPTPGRDRVLFAIENCLLSVEAPSKDGLPHADISFQPLLQCLDVNNLIKLFTSVLLERRILLRSNKYSLLTIVSEAICHLIYPFRWQHVYIPLLFFSGVDYIDAPTPYMMGLHSGVDTSNLVMDGVVVVDLEYNQITTTEEIPTVPEPELSFLRGEILKLLHPSLVGIDQMSFLCSLSELNFKGGSKPWGEDHDLQLRLIFLKFFASILGGYRNFIENSGTNVFNSQAFLRKRSRSTNQPPEPMIMQFLDSQGFLDYLERVGSDENNNYLLDKLQDAIGRGQNPISILPSSVAEPEIITISDPNVGRSGSGGRYTYDRFPSTIRTEEQEEKRRQILAAAIGPFEYSGKHMPSSPSVLKDTKADSLSPIERAAERERMVLDIKVKLQGLWLRLLKLGATDDPLSSFEYGTILALIESDAEGIGGSGFVECIREHIHSGWHCQLTEEQFIAVKQLLKTAIGRATSRNDVSTIRDGLEVSAEMYKKDANNVSDFVQRHLISLSIWEELRFWEGYFDYLMEQSSSKSANYATWVTTQLTLVVSHMAGLGLPDTDIWFMIETIAEKNNVGFKQFIKLRGFLSHLQQIRIGYWGISSVKAQSMSSHGLPSPHPKDATDQSQQPAEASGVGRSWVQSMFSRDTRANSFGRVRRWTSDTGTSAANENGTPRKQDISAAGQKKVQSNIRTLRGHSGAVTALHCVTRREVWDLFGDREDAGVFISGSTDCLVKIWDPSLRGSELRATLKGHTRTVRAISSDRGKVVSGSDDQSILVWDKQTSQLLEELKGHEAQVSCVRMLSGERVLTAAHDGTVKMWDVRTDTCVATVGRCTSAVLCMEYDDSTGVLAAAGRDAIANIWDIRAGKQIHKLLGHTKWIRSIRMVGDTVITGSDDWTARVWSVSRGTCDAVLACHAGPILSVEYSVTDKGIITGSTDGLLRFWENEEGGIRCVKNVTIHSSSILSINAGDHWLGIGAADNSMSLFHRPQERLGGFSNTGSKMSGWQLYRTPQRTLAVVRCVASDLERKRICSGGRNGLLRLWEATINI